MILTDLDNIEHQAPLGPQFRLVIDFLRRRDLRGLPDGEIPLDGKRVYAIVQGYETVMSGTPKFEYHRRYIDVQFILSGEEIIGWAPAADLKAHAPYDADKDVCFGAVEAGKWTPARLQAGQLAVLWPEDGHAPRLAAGVPGPVRKIVIKVAV